MTGLASPVPPSTTTSSGRSTGLDFSNLSRNLDAARWISLAVKGGSAAYFESVGIGSSRSMPHRPWPAWHTRQAVSWSSWETRTTFRSASGTADLAVAFMSLQDIANLQSAVAEVARVLVEGGRFCIAIAHPIRSAGHFDSKQPDSGFSLSSYFESRPWPWRSQHTGLHLELPGVHRPLEVYTTALEHEGFVIEAIREPRPSPEQASVHPETERWLRIPCFLHIRAVRSS